MAVGLSGDGIIAIGMTLALVSAGFDLSVGSVMGLSGVFAASLMTLGIGSWIACIAALALGGLIGLLNGYLIGRVGLNPFITTLGTMSVARGMSYAITSGTSISLTNVSQSFAFIGEGKILGISPIILIFVFFALAGDFLMRKADFVRKVFYVGSNEKAALLSGINSSKVKRGVYLLTAVLSTIAGLITLSRFGGASPSGGQGAEFRVISAAIIGGTSLNGGEGTILGTVLGIVFLNLINNGLILLNISVYWQDLVNGVILIVAVTVDHVSHASRLKTPQRKRELNAGR
jgi:ribose transport system permease protein